MQGSATVGRLPFVHGSHPPWPRAPFGAPERRDRDLVDSALVVIPVLVVILAFVLAQLL
jgi:hypothetical protein